MNKTSWIIFATLVAALIGGMIYLSAANKLDISDLNKADFDKVLASEDRNGNISEHTLGNPKAKVTVVEYVDYQCPGCSTAAPKTKEVVEKYKDKVLLIFRNFPIAGSHPNARAAAATAEAAGLQGKFWEMNSTLFENQNSWKAAQASERDSVFRSYAEKLNLNIDQYTKDIASEKVKKKIDFDLAIGRKHGVTATPSFFVNGEKAEMNSEGSIEESIKSALKKAGVEV